MIITIASETAGALSHESLPPELLEHVQAVYDVIGPYLNTTLAGRMILMNNRGCTATLEDFDKLDIRVGKVIQITPFPEGKCSSHVLLIDFGSELGTRKSLAKLTPNYEGDEVVGSLVLCVVNFPPRQIGKHQSEVLTLGVPDATGNVVLLRPDRDVPLGGRLY